MGVAPTVCDPPPCCRGQDDPRSLESLAPGLGVAEGAPYIELALLCLDLGGGGGGGGDDEPVVSMILLILLALTVRRRK